MTRITVFTGTRAEYGLLYWLLKDLQQDKQFELQVLVSGMHLSPEFGQTWEDIESDGFNIDAKVEMLLSSNSPVGVAKSMGLGVIGFADALSRLKPEILIILGDRFEALAIAQVALVMQVPIAHIHGGEITEGAYDDSIRHAITKMSSLHFVATDSYRKRVIQMGEKPSTVFNVGAVGLDHVTRDESMSLTELSDSIEFDLSDPYILVTYHSVTLPGEEPIDSFQSILNALDQFPEYKIVLTYPNADNGGRAIISLLESYANINSDRVIAIRSLGFKRYLAAVKHSSLVLGNSSSGIIEVPALKVPTVNVGIRQQGRLASDSVIHAKANENSIYRAIKKGLSSDFVKVCESAQNPYGQGDASGKILSTIKKTNKKIIKEFYDL